MIPSCSTHWWSGGRSIRTHCGNIPEEYRIYWISTCSHSSNGGHHIMAAFYLWLLPSMMLARMFMPIPSPRDMKLVLLLPDVTLRDDDDCILVFRSIPGPTVAGLLLSLEDKAAFFLAWCKAVGRSGSYHSKRRSNGREASGFFSKDLKCSRPYG